MVILMWIVLLFIFIVFIIIYKYSSESKNQTKKNKNYKKINVKDNYLSDSKAGMANIDSVNHYSQLERILIFDCETTGLTPGNICQLSYICLNGNNVIAKNFYFAVDYIEPGAQKVHNLSIEKLLYLSKNKRFKDHIDEIKKDFDEADLLIAHNFSFDIKFIIHEFQQAGQKLLQKPSFCTMKYFTDICKLKHPRHGYKYPRLSELANFLKLDMENVNRLAAKYFNIADAGFHDARMDVVTTYCCFLKGIEEGYIDGFNWIKSSHLAI